MSTPERFIRTWRDDPAYAAEMLHTIFPNASDYELILAQLADSIREANSVAPNAWAVTLFANGFRLNVGRVEALTAFDGEVRLLLRGRLSAGVKDVRKWLRPAPYRSVAGDNFIFRSTAEQFRACRNMILPPHHLFIALAGTTKAGRPVRGTPFRKFHSPGLVKLADASYLRQAGDAAQEKRLGAAVR